MLQVTLLGNGTTVNMFSILAPLNLSGWAPWNSPATVKPYVGQLSLADAIFSHQLDTPEPKRLDGLTDNRSL